MPRLVLSTSAVIATLALAGCGGGSTGSAKPAGRTVSGASSAYVNSAHVAFAIERSIRRQRHLSARVSCPAHIPIKDGRKFVCVASTSSGRTPFVVTEVNRAGSVRYVGK